MAIVTGIRDRRGVVEVDLDGCLFARVRRQHFLKCPLEEGQSMDPEAYLNRLAAVQFPDAWEAALTSLDCAARTARDIGTSLRRRGYVPPVAEAVVAKLAESGLIDDARYAERLAETQSKKPVGIYAFKRRLRARGISDADAESALAAFDDDQQQAACLAAAQKLYRKYAELPPREGRAKLCQALGRRGFGWDVIDSVVDRLFE